MFLIVLIGLLGVAHVSAADNMTIMSSDDTQDNLESDSNIEVLANESNVVLENTTEKAPAVIKANKITVEYNKGTSWNINLIDSNANKGIANSKVNLKIFTGNKYKQVTVSTDSNGKAVYKITKLNAGTHKVVLSGTADGYEVKQITSSIIVKPTKLKITVLSQTFKDGSSISIKVMDKSTKKPVNGVKLKLYVYKGRKVVKKITLKTKKFSKYKGVTGYATNKLSVGTHKVVIKSVSKNYKGSAKSKMKIKKSAKKYSSWVQVI